MSDQPSLLQRMDRTGVPLLLARLVLGGLFMYMAWDKVTHPDVFLKLIREYEMLPLEPPILINSIAILLPWVELLCGILLILGVALRGVSITLLLMLVGFTAIVALRAIGIWQAEKVSFCSIKFDCGCGSGEQYICAKIPENIGLCLLSIVVMLSQSRRWCLRGDLLRRNDAVGTPVTVNS
jgi:uncharacterized membrane protein YphA (DoxX/SURF4 family)